MTGGRVWDRLGALSGVVAVALTMTFFVLTDPFDETTNPNPTQPSAELARASLDNRDDARTGSSLGLAGAFLLLWFLGYLHRHLRRAEGEDGWLASVAYGGGLVTVGLVLVAVSFSFAVSELATYGEDTQVAKTYFIYGWNFSSVLAPPLGALVAGTAVVSVRFAALPRWLAWVSALIVVAMLVLAPSVPGLVALVGLAWIALVSLALFVRTWRDDLGPAPHEVGRAHRDPAR
ncbi:MAG: hypothetical protein M3R06_01445 [Chloroflexota bacterium]|nr:hypothetical protein [Chloroflexota bacterium]